jgi:hypothetical protein
MNLFGRVLFVLVAIAVGTEAVNYFVLGHTGDILPRNGRMGEWRAAQVRPACYGALEAPERDPLLPKLPGEGHRIDSGDFVRAREMTAALHCYVVTHANAICQPDNRAYIVDYIGKYFVKINDMLAIASQYGEDELRNVRQLWDSPRNREIQAAIEDNIRTGRLSKADFGWSVPAMLKPQLERHAAARDTCTATAAANRK